MNDLPDPAAVHERAVDAGGNGPFDVLIGAALDAELTEPDVARVDGGYEGPDAAAVGLAAAACEAGVGGLRYPIPDLASGGPWIVLEPCGGRIRTVDCGTATVEIGFEPLPDSPGSRLETQRERLESVFSAARPEHADYPVGADEEGVFTTGMTTFEIVSATRTTVKLSASTTPSTTAAAIRKRFLECPGVGSVSIERTVGVERADPNLSFREAIETAHVDVFDDCEYAWSPEPTSLSAIPSTNKVAVGAGRPDRFDSDDLADTEALLTRTVDAYEGET